MSRNDDSRSLSPLGLQARNIISEDTDWTSLAKELDVGSYEDRDKYYNSHTPGHSFRPMFVAYLWAKAEGISLSTIPDKLAKNPELAAAMGFNPDNLPSASTFKPVRLEEDRFADLQGTVDRAVKDIQYLAALEGSPISSHLLSYYGDANPEDDESEPTERTKDRLKRRKVGEVLEEINDVILPSMWVPRPDEAIYDDDELLTHEAIAAVKDMAANGAGKTMGDKKNPQPDIKNDPFYADGPTGETLLESIKEMSVDNISTMINFALKKSYTRAKPKLKELYNEHEDRGRFGVNSMIAMDITYVRYDGDEEGMKWLQGTPDSKDYEWCHKFATAIVVGENIHFVLAVCPLGSVEYADNERFPGDTDQSYFIGDVARRLLSRANKFVNIKRVYADREFAAADVISAFEEQNLKYVMPIPKNKRVKRKCKNFDRLKRGYSDVEGDTALYVKNGFRMRGQVKNSVSNEVVTTNLVILPPDEDDPTRSHSPQPFITNEDVDDEIALDRRWSKKMVEEYSDRATIENSYGKIKNCSAWTTSKEFTVRWFHFAFGCVVYNFWLLTDFLVQNRIGVINTSTEPEIIMDRFLDRADDLLVKLI